ncbi:SDR family NAD(P)-dependent oxidoreductase [Streptomyces sp. SID3343]|uniref:SDR family NAD(P)-dependent oxidoreductase n=1 Tax=Streptomyces sp. SID3343 TaxID=2690260 RepID=UPI00136C497D|nr:SDR family NAD(P)-dependent oxidoreductase [Streptomyces sp. SID3343]MYW01367.1 SDR family NAD(P)-dependent oxidoreductase [Streptomyces sp. SID3343]MYW02894.1 SDR family NAD(P)-dependent oxidoreductase [Streptomyces sp. SID3343]
MHLDNASALVTGEASGLGRAIAARLLDLPTSAGADVAETPARESGHPVRFVPGDVRSREDAATGVETAAELGPLHVAVNRAGTESAIRTVAKDGASYPQEAFEFLVGINLFGTFDVQAVSSARAAASSASSNPAAWAGTSSAPASGTSVNSPRPSTPTTDTNRPHSRSIGPCSARPGVRRATRREPRRRRPGPPRWLDQQLVRRTGVTRHSSAAR